MARESFTIEESKKYILTEKIENEEYIRRATIELTNNGINIVIFKI